MKETRLLLIEDDNQMADLLRRFLEEHDMKVYHVVKPSQALAILDVENFDLIILDLSLPEMDGLELCCKIREISNVHIIISSARTDLNDKLVGFENGADDYMPKPYSPKELLARIQTKLKRENRKNTLIQKSRFFVDENSTQIFFDKTLLKLTV